MFEQARDPPLEDPVGGAAGAAAVGGEQSDGVVREHAVLAAAVGDDLAVGREFGDPVGEFLDWDVDRAGQVPAGVFGRGADVEDDDVPGLGCAGAAPRC